MGEPSLNTTEGDKSARKIDPITALQDAIDGLSLSIFDALRSLRDAVAPESGNLGANPNQNHHGNSTSNEPDIEDLWHSYKHGDTKVRALMHKGDPDHPVIQRREDFIRLHAKMEMQKDTDLVFRLAGSILSKSQDIDEQVERLPGMDCTRDEQIEQIKHLLEQNEIAKKTLEESYDKALKSRNRCRETIKERIGKTLGIEAEKA